MGGYLFFQPSGLLFQRLTKQHPLTQLGCVFLTNFIKVSPNVEVECKKRRVQVGKKASHFALRIKRRPGPGTASTFLGKTCQFKLGCLLADPLLRCASETRQYKRQYAHVRSCCEERTDSAWTILYLCLFQADRSCDPPQCSIPDLG